MSRHKQDQLTTSFISSFILIILQDIKPGVIFDSSLSLRTCMPSLTCSRNFVFTTDAESNCSSSPPSLPCSPTPAWLAWIVQPSVAVSLFQPFSPSVYSNPWKLLRICQIMLLQIKTFRWLLTSLRVKAKFNKMGYEALDDTACSPSHVALSSFVHLSVHRIPPFCPPLFWTDQAQNPPQNLGVCCLLCLESSSLVGLMTPNPLDLYVNATLSLRFVLIKIATPLFNSADSFSFVILHHHQLICNTPFTHSSHLF